MQSVVCASCGARIRADRQRCLRCGDPLRSRAAAVAEPASGVTASWTRWGVPVAAGLALLVAAMVVVDNPSEAGTSRAEARPRAAARSSRPAAASRPAGSANVTVDASVEAHDATRVGIAAYERGDVAAALAAFESAAAASPDNPEVLNNLGQTLVRAGRPREALPHFARAIAARPDHWSYRFNEARAHAELEDWPKAIAGYRVADQLFPGDYATLFNLGQALEAAGEQAEAEAVFSRYKDLAPEPAKP